MNPRLAADPSPYLRQHANDPVPWWTWGEAAFREAAARDVPIFLSIGYATCHWCHVMQHESFADATIAALLGEHFVPIKVDREAMPDVDAIYIDALMHLNGDAGWPATLLLTPDRRPFAGATYLPPFPQWGLPSLRQFLERGRDAWRSSRTGVGAAADRLLRALADEPRGGGGTPAADWGAAAVALVDDTDPDEGGFGNAPKFPNVPRLDAIAIAAHDGVPGAWEALTLALDKMAAGGLNDALGGGFHRYCTDEDWTVPHFEKMLSDNALLLRLYARASSLAAARGDRERARAYIRVGRETAAFLRAELAHPSAGFKAAIDADDPGGEGFFYTFTVDEARAVLGDGPLPYGIRPGGHLEGGRSVLTTRDGRPSDAVRDALRAARDRRLRPAVDDKRIVAWNALAVSAFAEAGRLFGDPSLVDDAVRTATWLVASRGLDGLPSRLLDAELPGVIDDAAFLADALLDLSLALPHEPAWALAAHEIALAAVAAFDDPSGGFRHAAPRPDLVLTRLAPDDHAEPSGWAVLARVLVRLADLGAPGVDLARVERAIAAAPLSAATPTLWTVRRRLDDPRGGEVLAVFGPPSDPRTRRLVLAWNQAWRPEAELIAVDGLLDGWGAVADKIADVPTAWPCRRAICRAPVETPDALLAALAPT